MVGTVGTSRASPACSCFFFTVPNYQVTEIYTYSIYIYYIHFIISFLPHQKKQKCRQIHHLVRVSSRPCRGWLQLWPTWEVGSWLWSWQAKNPVLCSALKKSLMRAKCCVHIKHHQTMDSNALIIMHCKVMVWETKHCENSLAGWDILPSIGKQQTFKQCSKPPFLSFHEA